jgi:hypothetical protein
MADTIESLKKQINDLKREYQNLTGKPAALFEVKNIEDAEKAIRTLNGSLKNAYHEAEKLEKGFGGVYSEIQSILGELNKSENAANKVTKAFKGVERIARDLKDDQQGYNKLSIKELETRQKKLKSAQAETNLQASRLKEEKKSLLLGEDGNVLRGSDLRQRLQSLQIAGDITEEEQSILNGQEEGFSVLKRTNKQLQDRIDKENRINESMGLGGAILGSVKGALDKLGMGGLADKLGFDEAQEEMKALAEKMEEGGESTGSFADKTKILKAGFSSMGGSLMKNLKDPLTISVAIMTTLVKGAIAASNAINDIQKATGLAYGEAAKLQAEFALAAANSGKLYVNSLELNKAFGELTKQTGLIADFGGDTLETFVTLNKQLGLSAEAAGNLSLYARIQGEDTENILSNTVDTVNALNKQDKVAVNVKTVLSDIASVSKSIAGSLGFNPERLAGAAREARKLGLSLSEVDGIAESLLDFESSISAELEAELLTGKQLNFEKARSFALSNDLEGLSKEIGKNQAVISAFADEDRISQAAIAKSLGISRDQLAQMAMTQELATLGAEKFRDTYGDVAYNQLASLSASEKFQESLVKIQGVIGDIAIIFAPFLDGIANLAGWISSSAVAAGVLVTALSGIAAFQTVIAIKSMIGAVAEIFKGSFMAGPFGLPLAIAGVAALGGAIASISSAASTKGNDVISPAPGGSGYGKRTLFGPEGAISLNDKDTIVAGTDLKMGDDIVSPPQMGITETITNNNNTETVTNNNNNTESSPTSINIAPLVEQMNKMNATLSAILSKEGTVTLDGTKVGTALTVGSYKLQ